MDARLDLSNQRVNVMMAIASILNRKRINVDIIVGIGISVSIDNPFH